jgi:hypothetical protein
MISRTKGLSDRAADDLPRFLIQAKNSFLATPFTIQISGLDNRFVTEIEENVNSRMEMRWF